MEPSNQRGNIKRRPALTWGGRAPLFDRLCGGDPDQGSPRVYGVEEVFLSVVQELRALLNTRLPVGPGRNGDYSGIETVISYGLPDFSTLNAASPSDREMLARLIERKVEAFEPRLKQVFVSLDADPVERGAVAGTMHAVLQTEAISEPVTFRLLHGKQGVTLMESEPTESNASR